MNPLRLVAVCSMLVAASFTIFLPNRAEGCAAAPPHNMRVAIATETAIIIWDEKSETQHFIRRASFSTDAKDFGFLVPTPTKPDMSEADDEAFKKLAKITEPKVVTQKRPSAGGGCGIGCAMPASKAPGGAAPGGVEVMGAGSVSGFDYTILKATDADELSKWLEANKYDFSPELKDWAKHYIDAKWLLTAFKVSKDKDGKDVATKAMRMSFKTDKPFFPYREPETNSNAKDKDPQRLLRIYFLSTGKIKGTLGEKGEPWAGRVVWANKIETADREKVLELVKLPKDTPPESWWLTEFEDSSSPRPGHADVYFSPAGDQTPVERPPHIQYVANPIPDCVMSYALVAYLLVPGLVRRVAQRRNKK